MLPNEFFNVAVTGNAPFMEYDYNTSALVRDALPEEIGRVAGKIVKIWKYHRDTRDTYEDVRRVSHEIWGGDRSLFMPKSPPDHQGTHLRIDLVLHLGMVALGWSPDQFRFETQARRDGYKLPGDDGKYVDSAELEGLGLPQTLSTSLNVASAWRKVKVDFPKTPIFLSDDAGQYFCEFRLYSSLAEPLLHESRFGMKGRTVFEHLPQDHTQEAIALARDISVTFISHLAVDALRQGN